MLLLCLMLAALPAIVTGQSSPWRPNPIVRFWDLHVNPLEFRTPILLMPFDVKGSVTVYGGPDMFRAFPLHLLRRDHSAVILDSTESEMTSIQSLFSRLTFVYDADLVKFNPLYRFLPLSIVDVLVGVGLRTNQVPFSPALPGHWPPGDFDYEFAPVFHHILANMTVGYQRSENWYAYLQLARGMAVGNALRASIIKRYLGGVGSSTDFAVGLKFFRPGSGRVRYSWGGELRYYSLDVPDLDDPDLISPIEGLQVRCLGLFFTFGAVLGGRPSAADQAKRDLYSGDYMAAEENLRAFLERYPRHGKTRRANKLLSLVEGLVPYQQIDLARSLQQKGQLEEALRWLDRAETRADSTIMTTIDQGRAEIGYVYLERADRFLRQGNLDRTDQILRTAKLLLPADENLVERYEAEVLIRQGHNLRSQGAFTAALKKYNLAISTDTSRRVEIQGYQVRIAEDLLREAEAASKRDAVALALESLRLSQALDPRRKAEMDEMIVELENRLERLSLGEVRRSMEDQMQEARELRNRIPPTKPRIGLLVAQIEDILGTPDHVTQETDRFGINHQLWEYEGGEYPGLYYFENYILTRVEPIEEK
ncbi:MAG: hypothetical protein JSU77_01020 [Fidelibacterota bacterium]|nr:MAG: hypothetical protein JSU77_01020 [Candidatus Neomarinimicrobiota bacterium]